ncbi:MAG: hypothetical protein H6812_01000 [Phycisphaeraceae bacterium]|nr:hypothetical protein [Phycisphaerales bacterium]MCB9841811.1 hypothetical protein [Phycisphaeraceae bacterium]
MGWTNKYKPLRDEALRCLERHWSSVTELSEAECAELREEFCREYLREKAGVFDKYFERDYRKLIRYLEVQPSRDRKQLIASSVDEVVHARYYWPCRDRPVGFEVEGVGVRPVDLFVLEDESFAIITIGRRSFGLIQFHDMTISRFDSK